MTALCIADHCGIPNRHGEHCPGGACRGCLPRAALDGLRLCHVCTRRIAEDARTAAVLYEDMGLTLIRAQNGAQRIGAGHSSSGAPVPDDDGMEARSAIRVTLVSLARLIHDERGFTLPADDVPAMGLYVANNATWLAAHPAADEHAKDLRDIAGDRRSWRLAYPARSEKRYAGRCTTVDETSGVECGTDLYAVSGEATARCECCGEEYDVDAQQDQMRAIVQDSLARPIEIAGITLRLGIPVAYSTIASYAQRGRIVPHGHDDKGRALFRVGDVIDIRMEAKGPRRVRAYSRGLVNLQEG